MASKSFGTKAPVHAHLTGGRGVSGEITDLRNDVEEAFVTLEDLGAAGTSPFMVIGFENPAAKDLDYWKASTSAAADPVEVTTFLKASVPTSRNAVIDCTVTGVGEGNVSLEGLDPEGNAQTEDIAVPAATAAVAGTKPWSKITKMTIPPTTAGMTALALTLGTGDVLGLPSTIKSRYGKLMIVSELMDGAPTTAGTFVEPTTGLKCGTYAPNTIPNGTHDYVLYAERSVK